MGHGRRKGDLKCRPTTIYSRRPEGAAPPTPKRGYYVDFDFLRRSWVEYHSKVAAAAARQENTSTGKGAAAAVLKQLTARMLNTRGVSSFNY